MDQSAATYPPGLSFVSHNEIITPGCDHGDGATSKICPLFVPPQLQMDMFVSPLPSLQLRFQNEISDKSLWSVESDSFLLNELIISLKKCINMNVGFKTLMGFGLYLYQLYVITQEM